MNGERERILVVDDDAAVREAMALGLREVGYQVEEAADADTTLALLGGDGFALALAISLEAKDPYTQGHSEEVARLACGLGRKLGLSHSELETVDLAGRLHDIGKIGVRESVLNKPGRLTPDEFEHVKRHPALGAKILEPIVEDHRVVEAVLYHHENWDGSGYPQGLAGEDIPLLARVLRVCDIFEALTSERSYRAGRSRAEARFIMEEESGRTTCSEIAGAFFSLLNSS